MATEEIKTMHVVMFPWLAMGHLLPFLRLSKLLARKGHRISFVSTPRNISRLPKLPPDLTTMITFVPFTLPPVSGLPLDAESSMDVPYNTQQRLKAAFDLLQIPVTEFLRRSSPEWVVYDYASHWLPKIAAEIGVSKAYFSIFNAASMCFFGPPEELIADSRTSPEDFTVVPTWVPFESDIAFRIHEITKYVEKTEEDETGVSDAVRFGYSIGESDAVLVRSCPEFEPEWFGLLLDLYGKPVVPTGFLPLVMEEEVFVENNDEDTTWIGIKKWLDEQRVNSVVYVALGTEARVTRKELGEMALGLEKSALPFFWVLRNESKLPDGYMERVKGRGLVHFGWVPQVKILSHDSVGGFVTHCGWSSVIEGLGLGRVPILFPVVNDQGLNARLLQGKGLGVEIPRDERDGSFSCDSVADSIRSAMADESDEPVRAKVKEMKSLFGNKDTDMRHVDELVRYLSDKAR
ncbi:PREDICTED: UDP-glycosyltransferase 91C1 [Tarenaya hassleriana]|uniref:UDP-glycosyltransferase 91C1 n=1 Tax=Tarenaya hassleriana TaxID=28532 RepID=UPI00053C8CE1|nr:PREDICTED: UDP-glycosyltransferase 91C1 [Tarenaya hassleriana]